MQGETNQNVTYGAGIVIGPNVSGTHIYNNIIQNNVAGLFLANSSSTNAAIIQHNVFRNNNNAGMNGGRGIYTDGVISGGNLTNVTIDSNYFRSNYGGTGTTRLEGAIALESRTPNSQSNIRITNNSEDDNGKGVLVYNASNIDIENNSVTWCRDHYSAALRFEGGVTNVTIRNNTVYNNPGPAVRIDEKGFGGNNSGFVINNNNFYVTDTNYSPRYALIVGSGQYVGTLDATNNYWGAASGPSGDGTGTGDGVQANGNHVNFSPWATAPVQNPDVAYYGLAMSDGAPIQAEDFNHGGEGFAYHDKDTSNTSGQYRNTGVDIETTSDAGGGYDVTNIQAGEWLDYSISLSRGGSYDLAFRVANNAAGGTFHVEIDGVNVTGSIAVPNTGGTQKFATITRSGVALTAGQHLLRIVFEANAAGGRVGNFNWFQLTNTSAVAAPDAPTGLYAEATSPTSVNLTWRDNSSDETGFVIERKLGTGAWQILTTTAANVTAYTDATVLPGSSYTYRVRATGAGGDSLNSNEFAVATPALPSVTYLSDLPFYGTTINGWGPVERDQSVGGANQDDGNPITLNGVVYAKGLGAHAHSEVSFNLGGAYGQFTSDIGIDDEEMYNGSVVFQVFADGVLVFDSGLMTATSPTQTVNLDVTGVQILKLVVNDGGDGIDFDHADWAGARLLPAVPTPPAATAPNAPSGLTATAATSAINLAWTDNSSDEDGFQIERSTDGVNFSALATVAANVTSYSDSSAVAGTTYAYRIVAYNSAGASLASNIASASLAQTDRGAGSALESGCDRGLDVDCPDLEGQFRQRGRLPRRTFNRQRDLRSNRRRRRERHGLYRFHRSRGNDVCLSRGGVQRRGRIGLFQRGQREDCRCRRPAGVLEPERYRSCSCRKRLAFQYHLHGGRGGYDRRHE